MLKQVQNILEIQEVFGPVVHAATFDKASSEAKSKWYFVTKIFLTYCEKKLFYLVIEKNVLKFEAEGREFAKF